MGEFHSNCRKCGQNILAAAIWSGRRMTCHSCDTRLIISNTAGSVLDPIVTIRRVVHLAPDASATVHVISGATNTCEAALALVEKYHDPRLADRPFEMAWSHRLQIHAASQRRYFCSGPRVCRVFGGDQRDARRRCFSNNSRERKT